jgi:hypothetical protein
MKLPTLTQLRNWCHDGLAVVGFLGFTFGLGATALAQAVPADSVKYGPQIAIISGILLAASKAIDSLNNAFGGTPVAPVAPTPAPPPA